MTNKIRLVVVFGGRSGEHEISVLSAQEVIKAADPSKYSVIPVAIDKQGRWLKPVESVLLLTEETRRYISYQELSSDASDPLLLDRCSGGIASLMNSVNRRIESKLPDVIFPVLHGTYGEDGTLQGLLEMAGVPYIGCGVLASSCGMDKQVMKALFRSAGLPICKYVSLFRSEWEQNPQKAIATVKKSLGFPCFVKPANLGSSVGISRAENKATLEQALNLAATYDRKLIVEEAVSAREIECAILGNQSPEASLPGEYLVNKQTGLFLDYTEKYTATGNVNFVVPARLPEQMTRKIRQMALQAFRAIDGAGLARVDFFLRSDNQQLLINELNTMPGLTEMSGYPRMWDATGIRFREVIDRLVSLAFERYEDKARNLTSI